VYDGAECVLKRYMLDGHAEEWAKLQREVLVLTGLTHPHIVHLQAVFQQAKPHAAAYLQLELYELGDASWWLREASPAGEKRRKMLAQLAEALRHLHAHGVAHGDVKLESMPPIFKHSWIRAASATPRPVARAIACVSARRRADVGERDGASCRF
jgi:serine/threonine protein kinase